MILGALLFLGLVVAGAWLWWIAANRFPQPSPLTAAPRLAWRLRFPRASRFGVAEATAWFTALGPLLTPNQPNLTLELRSEGREVELRLTAPRSQAVALRGQLA